MWDLCLYFMVVSQSEAKVGTEHGIIHNILTYLSLHDGGNGLEMSTWFMFIDKNILLCLNQYFDGLMQEKHCQHT